MFELTKDKDYFVIARRIFERTREEVSDDKPILSLEKIVNAFGDVMSAHNEAVKVFYEDFNDKNNYYLSQKQMNELEVLSRLVYDIDTLIKYSKYYPNKKDLDDLRKYISILSVINGSKSTLNRLFDLYQLTGLKQDYEKIRRSFDSYVAGNHDIFEHKNLLEQIAYENI